MDARKGHVLVAAGLGLVALLGLVGALGAVGARTDLLATGAVAEGLVGHWKFDAVSGTIAVDASGLGNHGTLEGDPVYTSTAPPIPAANPRALDFDGLNDYVIVNGVAEEVAGSGGPWSASLWVKTGVYVATQAGLLAVNTAGDNDNVVILIQTDNVFNVYDGGGVPGYEAGSMTEIDDDRWHHLAYTSDGQEGAVYVDGTAEATHTVDYVFSADNQWSLGQEFDPTGPSDHFEGQMDEVRVYTRTLSALEVAELAITVTHVHLPLILRPRTWDAYYEENDIWQDAYGPLADGQIYHAYPNDLDDYYYFESPVSTTVIAKVEDYGPVSDTLQLLLYASPTDAPIGHSGDPGMTAHTIVKDVGPGRFYVRVYTTKFSDIDLYSLQVDY